MLTLCQLVGNIARGEREGSCGLSKVCLELRERRIQQPGRKTSDLAPKEPRADSAGLELAKIVLELATAAIHSSPVSLHPVWIRLHTQTEQVTDILLNNVNTNILAVSFCTEHY